MAKHPAMAFGSSLVQIVGLLIVIAGVSNLPSAGGWVTTALGGVLLAAATKRYMQHSKSE